MWELKFFINICREEFQFDKSLFHSLRYIAGVQITRFPTLTKDKQNPPATPQKSTSDQTLRTQLSRPEKTASALLPVACQTATGTTDDVLLCRELEAYNDKPHPGQQYHSLGGHMGLPGPLYLTVSLPKQPPFVGFLRCLS